MTLVPTVVPEQVVVVTPPVLVASSAKPEQVIRGLLDQIIVFAQQAHGVLAEKNVAANPYALEEHSGTVAFWLRLVSQIESMITTLDRISPHGVPEDDSIELGMRGVEALIEAMDSVVLPGAECERCGGTGRISG